MQAGVPEQGASPPNPQTLTGQTSRRLFPGKRNGSRTCLIHIFGRASTNLGRDVKPDTLKQAGVPEQGTPPQYDTLTHSHTHTLTHTHTHALTLTHSHTLTLTHPHTHTRTHSHTRTLTHKLPEPLHHKPYNLKQAGVPEQGAPPQYAPQVHNP